MSAYTEPLAYEGTEIFVGGRERPRTVEIDGLPATVCELVGARRLMRVTRGFIYNDARTGISVTIEPGFETDLGSIPSVARALLSPDDPWAQAYVVHDWHYNVQRHPKKVADLMLYDALGIPYRVYRGGEMKRAICPALTRQLIYRAVQLGGRYRPNARP